MDACVAGPVRAKEMDLALVSRMLADSAAIPFAVMQDGLISFANPAFMDLFRAGRNLAGTAMDELLSIQSRAAFAKRLSVPQNAPATFRGRAIRSGGPSFNIELHLACEMLDGVPMMGVFAEDVSLRQLSERHLSRLAYTDELTGLPNRAFLLDRLRDAIVAARKDGSKLAVLMADLDGLKPANDTLGHQGGDAVLQVTAQRFLACVRSSDTLARLGGDEFCVVLPRVRESGDTEAVAGRLLDAARRPIPVDGHQIGITVSIGIALYPDHGCTVDGVMKAADMALYAAKRGGRDRLAWASNSAAPNGFLLPLITWTAAHEVGIEAMDTDHRELFGHLNGLATAMRRADNPASVAEALVAVTAFSRQHFAAEECLMAEHGFAGAEAHRERHATLLDDLANFSVGCDMHSLSLTTRFLQEWLLRHLDNDDRALAKALRAKGVR